MNIPKAEVFHDVGRYSASLTTLTIEKIRLILIKILEFVPEGGGGIIQIDGGIYVTIGKFLGSTNIKQDKIPAVFVGFQHGVGLFLEPLRFRI